MRPSLATDLISLGFWLNISFVVNYRRAFRSIIAIAIDLLTSQVRYFLWITAVPLPQRCYTRAERATQSATQVGSLLLDSLTVPSTHYVPKIVFTFSPICRACTNSVIMRDFIFLCISPHQQSAISSGWLWWIAGDGRQRNQPHDCAMTWAFHVLQKICRIKIS